MIPKSWDWGSGRFGIGPLVTLPGDEEVARDEWGYGLAMAVVNAKGNWFYGILLTQVWRAIEPDQQRPPGPPDDTNPLGIVPIVNYKLAKGWYISNGDMVAQYDWEIRPALHSHCLSTRQSASSGRSTRGISTASIARA